MTTHIPELITTIVNGLEARFSSEFIQKALEPTKPENPNFEHIREIDLAILREVEILSFAHDGAAECVHRRIGILNGIHGIRQVKKRIRRERGLLVCR